MDRVQPFIKECLFTKNFDDPNKPIDEKRLQETLLLLPTDGGLASRLKRNKSKSHLDVTKINDESQRIGTKQPNYRQINKNSKIAFKEYINRCKLNRKKTLRIAHEHKLTTKDTLNDYLLENNKELYDSLPTYEKYLPMHEKLWVGYMKEILNIPANLSNSSKLSINGTTAMMKLSMADYNGSILNVSKSRNKNLIGIQGIVIWDSQKS